MSIEIQIFSNHNLIVNKDFNSVKLLIEDRLKRNKGQYEHYSYQILSNDFLIDKFEKENWPIYVKTNSVYCDFQIYKHFISVDFKNILINIKTHVWRKIIAKDLLYWALSDWQKEDIDRVIDDWQKAKEFISIFAKLFGGDKIYYFNDSSSMCIAKDLIMSGNSPEELIGMILKNKPGKQYFEIEQNLYDFTDEDWFYEYI